MLPESSASIECLCLTSKTKPLSIALSPRLSSDSEYSTSSSTTPVCSPPAPPDAAFVSELSANSCVDTSSDLAAALAKVSGRDLGRLRGVINGSPDVVPGLLAWLGTAVDWEVNRRVGMCYPVLGPRATVDDTEIERSLVTLAILAALFRDHGRIESKSVADFVELAAATLRAEIERPDTLQ